MQSEPLFSLTQGGPATVTSCCSAVLLCSAMLSTLSLRSPSQRSGYFPSMFLAHFWLLGSFVGFWGVGWFVDLFGREGRKEREKEGGRIKENFTFLSTKLSVLTF